MQYHIQKANNAQNGFAKSCLQYRLGWCKIYVGVNYDSELIF